MRPAVDTGIRSIRWRQVGLERFHHIATSCRLRLRRRLRRLPVCVPFGGRFFEQQTKKGYVHPRLGSDAQPLSTATPPLPSLRIPVPVFRFGLAVVVAPPFTYTNANDIRGQCQLLETDLLLCRRDS